MVDAAGVGAEGDDVAEGFELREGLVDGDLVALAMAFDCRGEAAEAGADDDDGDSGGGGHVGFLEVVRGDVSRGVG